MNGENMTDTGATTLDRHSGTGELITVDEAADMLGACPATIRRMLREGTIKGCKVRTEWRVNRAALRKYATLD